MAEFKKTQLLTLILIAALLFLTPFLSSSLRSTYLYFIINLLIISLGVEAGLLSSSPPTKEPEIDLKNPNPNTNTITAIQIMITNAKRVDHFDVSEATKHQEKVRVEEKSVLEDTLKVKKCPSAPTIFFIESKVEEVEELEEKRDEIEEEDLFVKAELRMQREDSWNTIHGFYQNGFN
ncbi:hypothetical protein Cgig2_006860 [Carnegiea gigantea]|uniref:DUF4408 domain-containing protein n=1 Tax=Carnegiea gigantea TaxID=171969 RepID=A0A9Q1JW46_9CARY|nr:hypothetical protein Cgig2_006860 [Carnegiea gigantea]